MGVPLGDPQRPLEPGPSWLEQAAGHGGDGGDGATGGPCCPGPRRPGGSSPVAEAGEQELQVLLLGRSDTEFQPLFSVKVVVGQERQGPCGGRGGWGPDEAAFAGWGSWRPACSRVCLASSSLSEPFSTPSGGQHMDPAALVTPQHLRRVLGSAEQ